MTRPPITEAIALRGMGLAYAEIADRLGISKSSAFAAVKLSRPCACGCGGRTAGTFLRGHQPRIEESIGRFWAGVDRGAPDECWEWTGRRDRDGYGLFGRGVYGSNRAHRRAWELANGAIPDGLLVLHHCDNPPCVNPAHLYAGTHSDNMWDRANRRRGPFGEGHHESVLSDDQVREVVALFEEGWVRRDIAETFGVSPSTVQRIGRGKVRVDAR